MGARSSPCRKGRSQMQSPSEHTRVGFCSCFWENSLQAQLLTNMTTTEVPLHQAVTLERWWDPRTRVMGLQPRLIPLASLGDLWELLSSPASAPQAELCSHGWPLKPQSFSTTSLAKGSAWLSVLNGQSSTSVATPYACINLKVPANPKFPKPVKFPCEICKNHHQKMLIYGFWEVWHHSDLKTWQMPNSS